MPPTNPNPVTNPFSSSNGKWSLIAGFFFLFIVGSGIAYYVVGQARLAAQKSATIQQEALKNTWTSKGITSSIENLTTYVDELNTQINDPNTPQTTKKLLLVREAQTLATVRSTTLPKDQLGQATAVLTSLYQSASANNTEETYRLSAIPLYLYMLFSTCYVPTLGPGLPPPYNTTYKTLVSEGYTPRAAVILAYREFAYSALPANFSKDVTTVMFRSFISATYLNSFGQNHTDPKNLAILTPLQQDVAMHDSLKALTLTGFIPSQVETARNYAFAYDIAHTYAATSTLSASDNLTINQNYDDAFTAIGKIQGDDDAKYAENTLNAIYYIESIYRRYPKQKIDQTKMNSLIDIFSTNMLASKEMKALFTGYFIEGQTADGSFQAVRNHFYEIAKDQPRLYTILSQNAGVVF